MGALWPRAPTSTTVYTIGHSTRPAGELADLLLAHDVEVLADTRSIPRSRHNPQFNPEELEPFLAERGIEYQHHPLLGGRRHARKDSPNTAWENLAFRGYADYMQTAPFRQGIEALEDLARARTVAVMCAELAWWRCHRRMISDRLTVDGFEVLHIMNPGHEPYPHKPSPGLTVVDGAISYPGSQPELPLR
ncbi:MAG TPA: DUF488 domain-containing protein [Chloroflexota bacterium]|nr:DUF488 domain-containing protein [Chloroflexota bacterium]